MRLRKLPNRNAFEITYNSLNCMERSSSLEGVAGSCFLKFQKCAFYVYEIKFMHNVVLYEWSSLVSRVIQEIASAFSTFHRRLVWNVQSCAYLVLNFEPQRNFWFNVISPRYFFVCEKMTVHQYRFEYFHLFFLNISRRHDILRVTKQFANFSESCRDGVTWQAQ